MMLPYLASVSVSSLCLLCVCCVSAECLLGEAGSAERVILTSQCESQNCIIYNYMFICDFLIQPSYTIISSKPYMLNFFMKLATFLS